MKRLQIFVVIAVQFLAASAIFAQTTVTGHISAEVVESVSASQHSQTSISFQRNQAIGIEFSQIEVKSAASATCSLILGKANLTSNSQQQVALETSARFSQGMQGNAINGVQSISLQYQPSESMLAENDSQYQGDINIVLAYN